MHTYKKYWLIAIMIAMAAGSIAAQTPKVSLSGDNPPLVIYDNNGTPTWITGSIVVTKNYSTVTDITVDLEPKYDYPYPRNSNWKYIGPSGDISQYIDACDVFFSQSTSGNVIKMWDTDSGVRSYNVYMYRFASNSGVGVSTSFNYYAVIWHDSSLPAGTYELPITFRVRNEYFDGKKPNTNPVSTLTVYLKFLVAPSASITFLSGTSGSTTTTAIVFDDVAATTTKDFRVSVKSNFRYSLSVSSSTGHGGNLKHTNPEVTEMIPYTLNVGTITNLPISSTPYPIALMERPTAESGTREYKAAVTVGNIQDYTSGTYSDSISFTVAAQ